MKSVIGLLLLALMASPTLAQEDVVKEKRASRAKDRVKDRAKDRVKADYRTEEALLEFVKENHGELVPLLSWLEKERPQAYQKAVSSIGRSATQISQLKNRNPDRYKTELRSWQLQSRIQLLAAQLAVKDTDEKRKELRGLVDESLDLRVDRLVDDVAAMEKRIEKMNDEIERLSSDRSKAVDAAMEKVVRTSKRMRDRKKKKPMKEDLETGQPVEDAETAKKTAAKKKKKAAEKKRKKDAKKKSESNDSAGE